MSERIENKNTRRTPDWTEYIFLVGYTAGGTWWLLTARGFFRKNPMICYIILSLCVLLPISIFINKIIVKVTKAEAKGKVTGPLVPLINAVSFVGLGLLGIGVIRYLRFNLIPMLIIWSIIFLTYLISKRVAKKNYDHRKKPD